MFKLSGLSNWHLNVKSTLLSFYVNLKICAILKHAKSDTNKTAL